MDARRTAPLRELQEKYPGNVTVAEIDITDTDAAGRPCVLAKEVGGMDYYIHAFRSLTRQGLDFGNPDCVANVGTRRAVSAQKSLLIK